MKRQIPALIVLFVVVACLLNPCFGATALFEDKFATLDPSWGAPSQWISVKDGKLTINGEKNVADNWLNQAAILPNDMDANVTLAFVKTGSPDYGSGLLFWAKDYNGWYSALINANGWFAVQRRVGDRFLMPVDWRKSDAVKKGEGVENQIRVVTKALVAQASRLCWREAKPRGYILQWPIKPELSKS
jgi:hypothetical protein